MSDLSLLPGSVQSNLSHIILPGGLGSHAFHIIREKDPYRGELLSRRQNDKYPSIELDFIWRISTAISAPYAAAPAIRDTPQFV